jgi:hypothetical protein
MAKLAALIGLVLMATYVMFLGISIRATPLIVIGVAVVIMAAVDAWRVAFRGGNTNRG